MHNKNTSSLIPQINNLKYWSKIFSSSPGQPTTTYSHPSPPPLPPAANRDCQAPWLHKKQTREVRETRSWTCKISSSFKKYCVCTYANHVIYLLSAVFHEYVLAEITCTKTQLQAASDLTIWEQIWEREYRNKNSLLNISPQLSHWAQFMRG